MLIGFGSDCAVYLFAYAKNERENISHSELLSLRDIVVSERKPRANRKGAD